MVYKTLEFAFELSRAMAHEVQKLNDLKYKVGYFCLTCFVSSGNLGNNSFYSYICGGRPPLRKERLLLKYWLGVLCYCITKFRIE